MLSGEHEPRSIDKRPTTCLQAGMLKSSSSSSRLNMQLPGSLEGPPGPVRPSRSILSGDPPRPWATQEHSLEDETAARDLLCFPTVEDPSVRTPGPALPKTNARRWGEGLASSGHAVDFFNSRGRDSDATASCSLRHRRPPRGQERGGPRGSSRPCPGPRWMLRHQTDAGRGMLASSA